MTLKINLILYYLILLSFFSIGCQTFNRKSEKKRLEYSPKTIPLITYITYDSTRNNRKYNKGYPAQITITDSIQIESLLMTCLAKYNIFEERYYDELKTKQPLLDIYKENFIITLSRYKRQYMAIINPQGEKEVWINCFCTHWNEIDIHYPVEVSDGGNCFFNLKINLSKGIYYDMMVNGDA